MKKEIIKFKEKWFKFTDYKPHKGQERLHFPPGDPRFIVAVCGRRWGKSFGAAKEIELVITQPKKRAWVVAPTYQTAEKVFREVWNVMINEKQMPTRRASYRDMYIEFEWGSVFEAKSADNPPSLVGEGLDLLVLDEAAKQKKKTWEMYLRPTLSDRKGKAIFITTPEGYNWVYELFLRGKDDEEWYSFNSPSWENQYAYSGPDDADLLEAKRNMSQEIFDQEYGSKFTSFAARVYPFDRELDVGNIGYNPNAPTYCTIDFGYRQPAVLWMQTYLEEGMQHINVIDEIVHERNVKTDELAKMIRKKPYHVVNYFGDPAGINKQSQSGLGDIEIFRRHGIGVRSVRDRVSRDIEAGISHVRSFIQNAENQRFLHVSSKCIGLCEDLENYRYPEHKEGTDLRKLPIKDGHHDHSMDALRYFFINRFPIRQQSLLFERKNSKWR
ncbi:MAG: putative terminase large subunit [Prokaryotic dsDNA virus sp.]|nr:MAG: putative terminase large subunit [Prokaryotic dsDNA virus sp.]|tara:strand:- start:3934 stop:5256 length:1323 start_codon:yes stop_codon:yes gene_type:complete